MDLAQSLLSLIYVVWSAGTLFTIWVAIECTLAAQLADHLSSGIILLLVAFLFAFYGFRLCALYRGTVLPLLFREIFSSRACSPVLRLLSVQRY
jgi:hypothetical protein